MIDLKAFEGLDHKEKVRRLRELSEEVNRAIWEEYAAAYRDLGTVERVAETLGETRAVVYYGLRKTACQRNRRGRPIGHLNGDTLEKLRRVVTLYKQGKPLREIAVLEGVTFQAVHQRLRRAQELGVQA